jgi:hypothetical protein
VGGHLEKESRRRKKSAVSDELVAKTSRVVRATNRFDSLSCYVSEMVPVDLDAHVSGMRKSAQKRSFTLLKVGLPIQKEYDLTPLSSVEQILLYCLL